MNTFVGFSQKFEVAIMALGIKIGMLSYNSDGYINNHIQNLFKMYNNGADDRQLKFYIQSKVDQDQK